MASYNLEITKSAQKEIRKLPGTIRPNVVATIQSLAQNPRPVGCQKLKGSKTSYRVRQGDYRIIYTIFDARLRITVVRIAHRKEVYRGL